MAGRVGRPIFRRKETQVAVRPIRLSREETVEAGTVMNDLVRPHHLRSLYNRRRIGPEGHPWTEAMLANDGFYKPEAHSGKEDPEPEEPMLVGSDTLDAVLTINGDEVQLGDVVVLAYKHSGLSVEEWNALEDEDRDTRLNDFIAGMAVEEEEQPEDEEEETPGDDKPSLMGRLMGNKKGKDEGEDEGDDWLDGEDGA